MVDRDRCSVCGLPPQILGCQPGACLAPEVPVDRKALLVAIRDEAFEISRIVTTNNSFPIAAAMAGAALIRAKIKTDGDDPEMWFDLIRAPTSEAGLIVMERLFGFGGKGQQ